MNITEDYVSFEVAKLLKEKGFDEGCSFVVNAISKGVMPVSWPTTNSDIEDEKASLIALPTLQMARKWLREKYNIHIEVVHLNVDRHTYYLYRYYSCQSERYVQHTNPEYSTYEEACEAAIKYCLENFI